MNNPNILNYLISVTNRAVNSLYYNMSYFVQIANKIFIIIESPVLSCRYLNINLLYFGKFIFNIDLNLLINMRYSFMMQIIQILTVLY